MKRDDILIASMELLEVYYTSLDIEGEYAEDLTLTLQ